MPDHPKSEELAGLLDSDLAWAHVVALWTWAAKYADSGRIESKNISRTVEKAARWAGAPGAFFEAALSVGWLEKRGDNAVHIHDWTAHQGPLAKKLSRDRKRLAKMRAEAAEDDTSARTSPPSKTDHDAHVATTSPRHASDIATTETRPSCVTDGTDLTDGRNEPSSSPLAPASGPETQSVEKPTDDQASIPKALFPDPPATDNPQAAIRVAARRTRKPKAADPDQAQLQADGDHWMRLACEVCGKPLPEKPWADSGGMWSRFTQARKARGIEELLRSLTGLRGTDFWPAKGVFALLSANAIEAGLAGKPARPAPQSAPATEYHAPPVTYFKAPPPLTDEDRERAREAKDRCIANLRAVGAMTPKRDEAAE